MPSEADARIKIDRLLREAGWNIEDNSQVSTEEAAADGRADSCLLPQIIIFFQLRHNAKELIQMNTKPK
jgi:predicted type IV restriction endonuclease